MKLSSLQMMLLILMIGLLAGGLAAAQAPETETPVPETAPPAVTAPADAGRIVTIDIRGNEHISESDIRSALKVKVGDLYDEAKVEADRVAIRDLGWFERVEAIATPAEGGMALSFSVTEAPVLRDVELVGVTTTRPSKSQLLSLLQNKQGQVANHRRLLQDIAAIEKAYGDEGYVYAVVTNPEIVDGVLRLTVLEGRIVEVRITGNKETKTYVIQRELETRPNQVYNVRRITKDIQRLYSLDFFENVAVRPDVGTEPGTVIVVFDVTEAKRTGMATFGGGWASTGGFMGFIEATKNNWRGTGKRIGIKTQVGSTRSYDINYYDPWIAPNHLAITLAAYDRVTEREAYRGDTSGYFYYDERRIGGSVTLSRPFGSSSRGYVTLRRDDMSVQDIRDSSGDDVSDIVIEDQSVNAVALSGIHDTRNFGAYPTAGGREQLTVENAGFFGGASYVKTTADLRRYLSFGPTPKAVDDVATLRKRKVIALRLLAGVITGSPPFLEQFLIGGGETLRGYKEDRFPGKNSLIMNTEFRFPLGESLSGVVFADVGDAWGGPFAERFGDSRFKAHVGAGVGVRVQSPLGPLRLDYGIGTDGGQLTFGFNQVF